MPDIGLLQGPPRARAAAPAPVPAQPAGPVVEPADSGLAVAARRAEPAFAILRETAPAAAIHVAASAVVSPAPPAAVMASAEPPVREAPSASPPPAVTHAPPEPIRARDLLWLLLALVVLIGTGLGMRDPWPADEPRFALVARDMVLSGEWFFPRVGGDLYQDKPPLFFWLLAIGYSITGSLKASFLVPAFLAAGGVMFLVYDLGRRLVSRAAGFAAALLVACTLQFVLAMRGAQIDPVLCFLVTFSVYALCRHLLLGPAWRWYALAGFAAGLGVITKGVGFLPMLALIPYFALRHFRWKGLAAVDGGTAGWRWWLAPAAMLLAISLWFVPMLLLVANSDSPEYAAYRDEILFKQTVGRYAAAWHHVKGWYYFILEVIPALWLPWSLLLFWLVPRFRRAWRERDARVWLPLSWVLLVLVFFSASPGKRGIYILAALPAFAFASLPVLEEVLAKQGVRIAGFVLGGGFLIAALAAAALISLGVYGHDNPALDGLGNVTLMLYAYAALCGAGLWYAARRAPLLAWPAALASLTLVFSYALGPRMNGERSGADFTRSVLAEVRADEELGFVAYKEQFLLYLDRPIVNFGHRRSFEGPREAYDASVWLNAAPGRVLLVPKDVLAPCFTNTQRVGKASSDHWYLVRAPASAQCAEQGDPARAIRYDRR